MKTAEEFRISVKAASYLGIRLDYIIARLNSLTEDLLEGFMLCRNTQKDREDDMIVKLLSEQIAHRWDVIKRSISDALPPTATRTPEGFNNILEKLLNDEMQCWLSYADSEAKAIAITAFTEDFSGSKSLLIYSFARIGTGEMNIAEINDLLRTFIKFAASKDCIDVCYYTALEEFVKIGEWFGGNADYKYVTISLTQGDSDESLYKGRN